MKQDAFSKLHPAVNLLFVFGRPLLEKLDRVKQKYGMLEDENGI